MTGLEAGAELADLTLNKEPTRELECPGRPGSSVTKAAGPRTSIYWR